MGDKIEVFILFNQEDRQLFHEFKRHLSPMEIQGLISIWDEDQIIGGTDRRQAIDLHLQNAPLVLLLVSANLMASRESYALIRQALATHTPPKGYVVPVLLHEADWEHSDFGQLAPLPANRKPIGSWTNRHAAFIDVAKGIRALIEAYKQSPVEQLVLADVLVVTITTPDGSKYRANVPADTLVDRLLSDILGQWLPLTLKTTGSSHFSLRPFSLDPKITLRGAGTDLELLLEALGPNEFIGLTIEDKQGEYYTTSVALNTTVGQIAGAFLGTKSGAKDAIVEWRLSATKTRQLKLEASLYDQGVCDNALLRIHRNAKAAEE